MAKICKKCGNQLKDTSKFCSKCGTPYVDEPNTQGMANTTINVRPQIEAHPVQQQQPSTVPSNQESGSKSFLFKLVKWVVIIGIVLFAFSAFCGKGSDEKKVSDNRSNTAATAVTNGKVNETNIAQSVTTNKTPIDNGYVNGAGVNLRKGPSLDAEVIRGLDHANVQVFAFTKDATGREWAYVRLLEDGTEGYIAKQYFKHSTSGYRKDTEKSIEEANSIETRAEDALVNFHNAITNKQYKRAYNLLSPEMQNYVGGYNKFVYGYGTTESSRITEINVISKNNSTAQLAYMLEAKDKFKAGTLIQHFSGTAKLVNNGGWKIAEVTAKKVGEQLIQ